MGAASFPLYAAADVGNIGTNEPSTTARGLGVVGSMGGDSGSIQQRIGNAISQGLQGNSKLANVMLGQAEDFGTRNPVATVAAIWSAGESSLGLARSLGAPVLDGWASTMAAQARSPKTPPELRAQYMAAAEKATVLANRVRSTPSMGQTVKTGVTKVASRVVGGLSKGGPPGTSTSSPPVNSSVVKPSGASANAGAPSVLGQAGATSTPVDPKNLNITDHIGMRDSANASSDSMSSSMSRTRASADAGSSSNLATPPSEVDPYWQAQAAAMRRLGDRAMQAGDEAGARRAYQTAEKWESAGTKVPGKRRYTQLYQLASPSYDEAIDQAFRFQGWKPVYESGGAVKYYSPNTPDSVISGYDPKAEPPVVSLYSDRPLYLTGSMPYDLAPKIPGYEWHHVQAPLGGDYSGYSSDTTVGIRNDNSGGTIPEGINVHTGSSGLHGTMDRFIGDEMRPTRTALSSGDGSAGIPSSQSASPISDADAMDVFKTLPTDQQALTQRRFWASIGLHFPY